MSRNGRNKIPRAPRRNQIIGYIRRAEAGAIILDMDAEIDIHEFAAIMQALTDAAKARGFTPGQISAAHARVMMAQNGLAPARPPE